MFDADVDSLFDVPISDTFVDDNADSGFGDVVDDAGFAVVNFVGHARGRLEGAVLEEECWIELTLSGRRHWL